MRRTPEDLRGVPRAHAACAAAVDGATCGDGCAAIGGGGCIVDGGKKNLQSTPKGSEVWVPQRRKSRSQVNSTRL